MPKSTIEYPGRRGRWQKSQYQGVQVHQLLIVKLNCIVVANCKRSAKLIAVNVKQRTKGKNRYARGSSRPTKVMAVPAQTNWTWATESEPIHLGFNPSEKYENQLGWLFPIYGKKCSKPPTRDGKQLRKWKLWTYSMHSLSCHNLIDILQILRESYLL